jgi:hypothetical protein
MITAAAAGALGLIKRDHRREKIFSVPIIQASLEESIRLQRLWEARKKRPQGDRNCPFDSFLLDNLLYFLVFTDRLLVESSLSEPEKWMDPTADAVREWYLAYTLARQRQFCGITPDSRIPARLIDTAISDSVRRWGHGGKRMYGLPETRRDPVEVFAPSITLHLCGDDRIERFPTELAAEHDALRSASNRLLSVEPYLTVCIDG